MSGGYALVVNGRTVHVDGDGTTPLLSVLREQLALRGSRFGCGTEQCGACMVLIDGEPSYSCAREVATVAGKAITTVEGLAGNGALHPLQQAFLDEQAGQCPGGDHGLAAGEQPAAAVVLRLGDRLERGIAVGHVMGGYPARTGAWWSGGSRSARDRTAGIGDGRSQRTDSAPPTAVTTSVGRRPSQAPSAPPSSAPSGRMP